MQFRTCVMFTFMCKSQEIALGENEAWWKEQVLLCLFPPLPMQR